MKTKLGRIFNEFQEKIINSADYHPSTPEELLKASITATRLLQHPDPAVVRLAKAFIKKTSLYPDEYLVFLQHFSSQVLEWDRLQLCSTYTNLSGTYLEYKIFYRSLEECKEILHFHARFEIKEKASYFVSQTPPLIRLIADPILHKPGTHFPQCPTPEEEQELKKQIEYAKHILIQTSGAGIAANQCAEIEKPYRFIIVGVFHEIQKHTLGVAQRYPNTSFPQAIIMVNPIITSQSTETQVFNHACLSIPFNNRCTVSSPMEINVSFQDPRDAMKVKELTYSGVDAVVLWHELTHILQGKTYMDVTLESLPLDDLILFQKILSIEFQRRQTEKYKHIPDLTATAPFHLSIQINKSALPKLDPLELKAVLPKMNDETVVGLLKQAHKILIKNDFISHKIWPELSFYSSKKNNDKCNLELIRPKL